MVFVLLFMLVFGLFEFGRYIAITSTVTNASREAARYAVGTGPGLGGGPRYADCDGMRDAAQNLGVIGRPTDAQINLDFDGGPSTAVFLTCSGSTVDPTLVSTGDRMVATISVPYTPVIPIISSFLGPTTIVAETVRTINKG